VLVSHKRYQHSSSFKFVLSVLFNSMVMAYFSNSFNWNFIVNWIPYKMLKTFWKLFRLAKVQRQFKSLLPTFVFCFVSHSNAFVSDVTNKVELSRLCFLILCHLEFLKTSFCFKNDNSFELQRPFPPNWTFLEFFSQGGWAEKSAQTHKKSSKLFSAWKVKNGFVRR
jgi:hypothetical protein